MFNTLKRFFGRRGGDTVDAPEEYPQFSPPPGASPVPRSQQRPGSARAVRVDAQSAPAVRPHANAPSTLGIPLKSIIARLPADLMQRVRMLDVGEAEIFLPMQKVLAQISSGAIRLSFGELRQIAPPGTFTPENDRDRALVELPLHEVLARLNPGLLSRRPAQRHVEVPPEVTGPFGGQTRVTFSTAPLKPAQPVRPDRTPAGQPPLRGQPPGIPTQPMPRTQPFTIPTQPAPRVQPAVAPAGQPVFARIRPASPVPQAAPVTPKAPAAPAPVAEASDAEESFDEAPVFTRNAPVAPRAPARPVYSPIAPTPPQRDPSGDTEIIQMPEAFTNTPPVAPITPIAPVAEPEPAPIRFNNAPVRAQAPAPSPVPAPVPDPFSASAGETRFVNVSMADLSQSWPEALRQEIDAKSLSGQLVGLPFGAVEGVIKSGKIAFPWKAIRAWIKAPVPAYASPYDTTLLEMPLKVVTPLFLAELKATRSQRKVSMDEAIPDLFFDARVPEAVAAALAAPPAPPAAAVPVPHLAPPSAPKAPPAPRQTPSFPAPASHAKPADTNYFVWKQKNAPAAQNEPAEETEDSASEEPATPGTAFLNRYATPNEIVSKAAALDGVDGALIALPDGLLVASRIPPNMNADTIAAFLPQIFGRVSQCTRELRLGELNNLNFTVGNIPWKIFRVGAIYFAAFGRPGVPLPTAQLVGLAAELDRKAK